MNSCITLKMIKDPAITHYKYKDLEWWSEFDDYDNEIYFKSNKGYEHWTSWEYDNEKKYFIKIKVEEKYN